MASYTLQGFTNDASSADLDATNLNEMDNAIKIGHDFADSASATPSAGKAMVWPSAPSGVFTPVVAFGGNSVGVTYASRVGRYVISGGVLHFWTIITLASKGTSEGRLVVSGLPQKSASSTYAIFSLLSNNMTFVGYPVAYMGSGLTGDIIFESENQNGTYNSITNVNCTNNLVLFMSGMYEI